MKFKTFVKLRLMVAALIGVVVAVAAVTDNFYLAIIGIFIGVLFMILVNSKYKKIIVDERVVSVSGMASRATYAIAILFFAIIGLFLIISSRGHGDIYGESIGTLFSYVAMFLIAIYSITYHYFNKKYGGDK
jgi:uncharacterized membrane protein